MVGLEKHISKEAQFKSFTSRKTENLPAQNIVPSTQMVVPFIWLSLAQPELARQM
jgi:hypothetical protein